MALEDSPRFSLTEVSGVSIGPQTKGRTGQNSVVPAKLCFWESRPSPLGFQKTAYPIPPFGVKAFEQSTLVT